MSVSSSFSASPRSTVSAMRRPSDLSSKRSLYDEDKPVSPVLERTPSWSGTRWTRFFPELSTHFSLVSPVSSRHQSLSTASGAVSISSRSRKDSSASQDTSEPKTGSSSPWSLNELADDASSCYSRRSSVTSLASELPTSAYQSADAYSIICPANAGVFDDTASVSRSGSIMSKRSQKSPPARSPSVKDKPLPCPPPIQMAPLSIRRKKKPEPMIREDTVNEALESTAENPCRSAHHPTLSQAAEELENALAGLVEHKQPLPRIDEPLQISRGNMDMVATRKAPSPPAESPKSNNRKSPKASPSKEMKSAKKPLKDRAPFSFSVPGFRRKSSRRSHLRSLSGSNIPSGLEQKQDSTAAAASKEAGQENEADGPSGLLGPLLTAQRAASVSSERELRLKLPPLQTKEAQPSCMQCKCKALDIPAADEEAAPQETTSPKPRKSPSSEGPEGTMSKDAGSSEPIGPSEMDAGSSPKGIYELESGLPEQQIKTPVSPPFVPGGEMPGTLPDEIVGLILRQCSSLPDLFNFAVMNKQFYRVFKQNELDLIKSTVFQMSPPAWELREMSPPWDCEWQVLLDLDAPVPEYTPSLYLDRHTRDLYTLVKLKSLILARCGTFLRPETIRGLAGQDDTRAAEIDNAFWRVWTFCRIFGCGKGREGDVVGQLDWLNGGVMAASQHSSMTMSISEPFGINNVLFEPPEGFGRGNKGGLSQDQLYDMTEIWTCLGVLLQPINGKCEEARRAGVFNGHDVAGKDPVKEEKTLEEWTFYILTLGLSAVLALGSIANVDNADEIFQRAQSLGLTKWDPADASRSIFFREAVSKAYKPNSTRRSPPLRQTGSNSSRSSNSSTNSNVSPSTSITEEPHRRRQAAYAAQLRNRRTQNQADLSYISERPISSYAEIMNRLAGAPAQPLYQQPVPALPAPSLVPPQLPPPSTPPPQTNPSHNIQIPYCRPPRPAITLLQPQVRDPVDQALEMMVGELGFNEDDAKWALKITDTGEGINPNAAMSLLIQEYQRQYPQLRAAGYSTPTPVQPQMNSILSSVIYRQGSISGWRWA
ncbi:hypothetical protein BDW62DRAFT_182376 [Aspergillus aurantiobrunneus]